MTQILVVGDIHFTPNNQLAELFIKRIGEILSQKEYDGCILLGDIFHTHEKINETSLNMIIRLFYTITKYCHLYVLVGNHDYKDGNQFLTNRHALVAFKEWEHITVIDKPKIVKINDTSITLCPFVPKGRFQEAIEKVDYKNTTMIFCHQEFEGAKMGSIISYDGDKWNDNLPQVISGHIHEKQNLKNGVYYPGVPFDHSFGYSGKRVVTSITFNENDFKIKSIETGLPRKKILYLSLEEAKIYNPDDNYVKLVITCRKEEYNEFLKSDCAKKLKKSVTITHKADNYEEVTELLKDRKLAKCETYKETLQKLIDRENDFIRGVYKKIIN